jgi:membrane protease YdiL (CAAX protease family)
MGPWTALAWSAVAYAGLFSSIFVQLAANAWAGKAVQLPQIMYELPLGHIAIMLVVLLAARMSGQPMREFLGLVAIRHRDVWIAIGIGVATFAGMSVLFAVTAMISKAFGIAPEHFDLAVGDGRWRLIASIFIAMVIAAPIAEELLFRGLMYRGLSGMGVVGAIVISSIIFGLAHSPGFGWERAFVTGCVGVVLAVIRWRTGGTSMGMVTHAATNFVGASALSVMILMA